MTTLQRITEVRRRESMSRRTLARHLCSTIRDVRRIEDGDIRLSELHRVAEAMGVPASELICDTDHDDLQKHRSALVRIAKITNTLMARLKQGGERRLVESIRSQIDEVMPGSESLGELNAVGQQRTLDDLGRVAMYPVSEHQLLYGPEGTALPRWECA